VFEGFSYSLSVRRRIRDLIEGRECELMYLPAYSPDYNPIEEAFAKIKNLLRRAATRGKEALVEAMGEALSAVSAQDLRSAIRTLSSTGRFSVASWARPDPARRAGHPWMCYLP